MINKVEKMENLMQKIGYTFKNENYLKQALTHRSFTNENIETKGFDNEKLEFLGDAVLNLITTEYIYQLNLGESEGDLAKLKSKVISETIFSLIAYDLEIGKYMYLSKGENINGGRERKSILGDAFEAVIGAIFCDSDYITAKGVALKFISDKIKNLSDYEETKDYKTSLQELYQSKYKKIPEYELVSTKGPDHDKWFEVIVRLKGKIIGNGGGKSKKEAERKAAKEAIKYIKSNK